jgi:hypothetical protein
MIYDDPQVKQSESPGPGVGEHRITYALENHWHPGAAASSGTAQKYSNSP